MSASTDFFDDSVMQVGSRESDANPFWMVVACILAVLLVAASAAWFARATAPPVKLASATLLVNVAGGHGSGVHVGKGYVWTARHVVEKASEVKLVADDGAETAADVLFANEKYDLALLYAPGLIDKAGTAPLFCGEVKPGTRVRADGNPFEMKFVSYWGRVAGKPSKIGFWESVYPVDMTIGPGMSGGPVFDKEGRVVGFSVGTRAFVFSLVVPSSVACKLVGRA